jgi:hypothetical protein
MSALRQAGANSEQRKYLGVDQAEMLTSISRWTWRRWASCGRIQSIKLGGRLLIAVAEIERLIAENTRPRLEQ